MAVVKLQCPNCSGKLKFTEGQALTCPYCGTELIIKENTIHYVDQSVHNYYGVPAPVRPAQRPVTFKVLWLLPVALIVLFLYVFANVLYPTDPLPQQESTVRAMPESGVLLFFLRDIFDKGAALPTEEEIASIRYLAVHHEEDQWHLTYSFDDPFTNREAELIAYTVQDKLLNTERIPQKDFEAFSGLTALHLMNEYEIDRSDWGRLRYAKGLKSYRGSFNESFSSLSTYFQDKADVTELAVQIRSDAEMEMLKGFPNLQSLDLTYVADDVTNIRVLQELPLQSLTLHNMNEIGWLSSMTNLTSLTIERSKATDVSALFAMSKLQDLRLLWMENLKTIDFVQNMPNLQAFTLERTEVTGLESLRDKKSLTRLSLVDNPQLKSFEVVNSLPSLSELTMKGTRNNTSGSTTITAPAVKKAEISAGMLDHLEAPSLQVLTVEQFSDELDVSKLTRYKNLEKLTVAGSGNMVNVLSVNELPLLEDLDIEGSYFYDEAANLFALKHVKTLRCADCQFISDPGEKVAENQALQHLVLETSQFRLRGDDSSGNMQAMMPYLAGQTALREFTLQDNALQSLDFMKNWKQLEVLHVENSAITDIGPLTALPNLKKLYILGNPVQNQSVLGDGVLVY